MVGNRLHRRGRNGRENRIKFNSSDHWDRVSQTAPDNVLCVSICQGHDADWLPIEIADRRRPLQIKWKPDRNFLSSSSMAYWNKSQSWEKGTYINSLWSSGVKRSQIAEVVGLLQQTVSNFVSKLMEGISNVGCVVISAIPTPLRSPFSSRDTPHGLAPCVRFCLLVLEKLSCIKSYFKNIEIFEHYNMVSEV